MTCTNCVLDHSDKSCLVLTKIDLVVNHRSHIKQKKRICHLVNYLIDNAYDHPLSSLKFVLIEQVSIKTEEFLEQREGYWQAQLWAYEPYGFNAKKEFNSGRKREFLS